MRLQDNFQPDIPSKAVSTLLEILGDSLRDGGVERGGDVVSTLLEILDI
jgi:hypothetical protein